jgi:hypothetical protein
VRVKGRTIAGPYAAFSRPTMILCRPLIPYRGSRVKTGVIGVVLPRISDSIAPITRVPWGSGGPAMVALGAAVVA